MRLRPKFFLSIVGPLVLAIVATSFLTMRVATEAMLAQKERDATSIAQLLARSSGFALRVPAQVEGIVAEQMVVEARLAAHLVAVAEGRARMSSEEIRALLRDVTSKTALDEFWITDETAYAYLTNTDISFTFSADPKEQPQAHIFHQLLSQKDGLVIQEARQREVDPKTFKYVGVSGIDKPRIVQVGYEATILEELSRDVNVQRLVDELTGQGSIASVRVMDAGGRYVAVSTAPLRGIGATPSAEDVGLLSRAFSTRGVSSEESNEVHRVAVPLVGAAGEVQLVALVYLVTDDVATALRESALRSALIAAAAIVLGVVISFLLSGSVVRPVLELTGAAGAIERGEPFEPEGIDRVAKSRNELGQLARVFGKMAAEVRAREQRLRLQLEQLLIQIDEARKAREVAEITESEYFQSLQRKARQLKKKTRE